MFFGVPVFTRHGSHLHRVSFSVFTYGGVTVSDFTIALPETVIEQIEARVEARILERMSATADTGTDRWLRGTASIASYLDCPPSRVSALISAGRMWPVEKDGRSNLAKTSDLDKWIKEGGGIRP